MLDFPLTFNNKVCGQNKLLWSIAHHFRPSLRHWVDRVIQFWRENFE
jgi:hypothetical protein